MSRYPTNTPRNPGGSARILALRPSPNDERHLAKASIKHSGGNTLGSMEGTLRIGILVVPRLPSTWALPICRKPPWNFRFTWLSGSANPMSLWAWIRTSHRREWVGERPTKLSSFGRFSPSEKASPKPLLAKHVRIFAGLTKASRSLIPQQDLSLCLSTPIG